jgi:hypothetical protein
MRVDHLFLRLEGRVFEVLSDQSDYQHRVHVDAVGFAIKGPDRKGRYKVLVGRLDGDREGLVLGATRTGFDLEPEQLERFEALVALTKAARDAGPAPW